MLPLNSRAISMPIIWNLRKQDWGKCGIGTVVVAGTENPLSKEEPPLDLAPWMHSIRSSLLSLKKAKFLSQLYVFLSHPIAFPHTTTELRVLPSQATLTKPEFKGSRATKFILNVSDLTTSCHWPEAGFHSAQWQMALLDIWLSQSAI